MYIPPPRLPSLEEMQSEEWQKEASRRAKQLIKDTEKRIRAMQRDQKAQKRIKPRGTYCSSHRKVLARAA